VAAHRPELVRRLSISGVPLHRPLLGRFILNSWIDGLSRGNMRECAYSFLLNGYSAAFMEAHYKRLPSFVDIVVKANDPVKLLNLLQSNHNQPAVGEFDDFSTLHCSKMVRCPTQLIGFTEDRLAGLEGVQQLAESIAASGMLTLPPSPASSQEATSISTPTSASEPEMVTMRSGHLGPYEAPLEWRKHVLSFLQR
jgi:hypothetical protein